MARLNPKERILQQAGYAYSFDRMVYFNRHTKKVFSVEFVEDHSEKELQRLLGEETEGALWHFYFNSPPPDAVKNELESVLG
ncbi:MAG: hypothetical protein V2A77_06830 [Pseudomonadota bacterium]